MSMLEKLRASTPHLAPPETSIRGWITGENTKPFMGIRKNRPPIEMSSELRRVLDLPRRAQVDLEASARAQALVELMTDRLTRGTRRCDCESRFKRPCITKLLPAQAWALYEAPRANGLLAPIGVGHGKTGLGILLPMVMADCKVTVLLIPPNLREQFVKDYHLWSEHFETPSLVIDDKGYIKPGRPVLHVIPYSKFSRPESTTLLEQISPDLIEGDEAHRMRDPNTATTGRVLRRFEKAPDTRLGVWSGTFTSKSIKDYAHLSAHALREKSPLPISASIVNEWSTAIDPSEFPAPPGELRRLCEKGETLYQGIHRRLTETLGVVATKASAIDAAINLHERKAPPMPSNLARMLDDLRSGWVRPDGEELLDILEVSKSARQLACGFYYRWTYPKSKQPGEARTMPREEFAKLVEAWFAARKAWRKELREKLKDRREHLDSELLCTQAAIRFYREQETGVRRSKGGTGANGPPLPVWEAETWLAWREIKDRIYHETEAVWVDDYLVRDTVAWAQKHRGIVWYEHDAFGQRVADLSGLPKHGGGPGAGEAISKEKGKTSIIASIKSHGTGRDGLQRVFAEQLVPNPPASGDAWDQLLGRLHRIGFTGDEIDTYVYRHTPEMADALDKAIESAKYIQGTMGTEQKLLIANVCF